MTRRWSFLAGLLGTVLAVLGTGCGGNPNLSGGKLHFDQAGRLQDPTERAARFRRARDTFRKAVAELPKSGDARLHLGMAYGELGQPDSACIWFEEAVKTDPLVKKDVVNARDHYWSLMFNAGLASAKAAMEAEKGENKPKADSLYRYSLTDYRKAAVYAPERVETHNACGVVYNNLGMVDSALTAFARAQRYAPNDTKIHGLRIAVLKREGDRLIADGQKRVAASDTTGAVHAYKAAQGYFQQALDLKPTDANLIFYLNYYLGVTSDELSNLLPSERPQLLRAAADYYQRVLADDPTYLDALYNLFVIQKNGGEVQKALQSAKRMVDLRPKGYTYWGLYGGAQSLAGNRDRVKGPTAIREALKRGDKIDPGQAQGRATASGATSDIMRRYRENGVPNEIRVFKDLQGVEWENWFYWTRGTAYGFSGGSERYSESYAPAGTLSVDDAQIVDRNGAKFITGTVTNSGNHTYEYCRVEFNLLDETRAQVGWVSSSVDKLDPKGKWNFEIPLSGDGAKATTVEPPDPDYPANGF
jgi:tetratricopeptide (TPR) repeat protein